MRWLQGLGVAVKQAVAAAGISPADVAAVCVDTTCCTVVALDERESFGRRPVPISLRLRGPGLLWQPLWPAPQQPASACRCRALLCHRG